jgi:phosphatidylglycerophosphatase A
MVKEFQKMCATFFYIGDIPVAPGSAASVAALFLAVGLMNNIPVYIAVTIVVTIIGFLVSGKVEERFKQKDPSWIVIDEIAGGMIAFFLLPINLPVLITAYFLFRAFDMFKIYPVDKFESIPGSAGIMMDDIFAGLYTNLAMHAALRLSGVYF